MCVDSYTKAFTDEASWMHACGPISAARPERLQQLMEQNMLGKRRGRGRGARLFTQATWWQHRQQVWSTI